MTVQGLWATSGLGGVSCPNIVLAIDIGQEFAWVDFNVRDRARIECECGFSCESTILLHQV